MKAPHVNGRFCGEDGTPLTHEMSELDCDRFDTELLIDEVQNRPAIWNTKCSEYKDRGAKKMCWEELTEIFCSAGDTRKKLSVSELSNLVFFLYNLISKCCCLAIVYLLVYLVKSHCLAIVVNYTHSLHINVVANILSPTHARVRVKLLISFSFEFAKEVEQCKR